jgi:hypothetical protein
MVTLRLAVSQEPPSTTRAFPVRKHSLQTYTSLLSSSSAQSPKAPSTLSLHADQIGQWGYIVCPCNKEVLSGLKALFNDAEQHPTTYGPSLESKQLLSKYGRKLADEVGYYLTYAVAACTPDWRERFNYAPYAIKAVFTVPAAWSEETRDRCLVAVNRLGLSGTNVMLVSEPEAAVVDVLKNVKELGIEVCLTLWFFFGMVMLTFSRKAMLSLYAMLEVQRW